MTSLVGALALSTPPSTSSTTTSTTRAPAPPSSTSTTTTEPPFVPPTIPEPDLSEIRRLLRGTVPESASPENQSRPHRHATPTPAGTAGVEQWRELVSRHFAAADVDKALRVIYCESRGIASVVRRAGTNRASGLFQHLPRYWSARSSAAGIPGADILDPEANVIVAAWLVYRDGWRHWPTCGR